MEARCEVQTLIHLKAEDGLYVLGARLIANEVCVREVRLTAFSHLSTAAAGRRAIVLNGRVEPMRLCILGTKEACPARSDHRHMALAHKHTSTSGLCHVVLHVHANEVQAAASNHCHPRQPTRHEVASNAMTVTVPPTPPPVENAKL